jgi:ribosomal protein S18 acetylase RimI-like enzyme
VAGDASHVSAPGVARALLEEAFEELRQRGAHVAEVDVDRSNATGAMHAYQCAGMRERFTSTQWRLPLKANR